MSSLDLLLKQMDDPSTLSWKDETYDLALAGTVTGADRQTFIARLMAAAKQGDARAVLTLGHVSAVEAVPDLLALGKTQQPLAATARRALVLLGRGGDVAKEIANDALRAPSHMMRVAAVLDLPKIGGALAIDTLQVALADEDATVRRFAWDGLVQLFDLAPHIQNSEGKRELTTELELLKVLLSSDIAAFVRMGVDGMRKLVKQLAAGATPSSLGILWAPNPAPEAFDRIRMALFDPDEAFPVDDIARLTGVIRRWAEFMIAVRLQDQDARVPDVMARLQADWTVPALEEVAQYPATPPELRDSLVKAIKTLQAS
jgi:hypothetical protein